VTAAELLAKLNQVELRMLHEPHLIDDLRPQRQMLQAALVKAELAERREPEMDQRAAELRDQVHEAARALPP
jgi:hypothetical protein